MKEKLEKQLYAKYPEIFGQHTLDTTKTRMCDGFACGDGWYGIIDSLCALIQNHVENERRNIEYKNKQDGTKLDPKSFKVEATQVKEKFGDLRFYIDGGDDYVYGLIAFASYISGQTCEDCGSNKNVTKTNNGWIRSLCSKCHKKTQSKKHREMQAAKLIKAAKKTCKNKG